MIIIVIIIKIIMIMKIIMIIIFNNIDKMIMIT